MSDTIKSFWDEQFKSLEPKKIDKNDLEISNDLDEALVFLGHHAETVVEVGVGSGYGVLMCHAFGRKVNRLIGFDPSKNAIEYLEKTCQLSNINAIDLHVADHTFLYELKDASVDGFISLNVLDVLTPSVSDNIIDEMKRILKPGGYLVLKFNFMLNDDIIERTKAEEIEDNVYAINGVLRAVNRSLDEWKNLFKGYEVIREGQYERIKEGPLDRVLVLKKPL
jgi:SAM-dependent methyltransferase